MRYFCKKKLSCNFPDVLVVGGWLGICTPSVCHPVKCLLRDPVQHSVYVIEFSGADLLTLLINYTCSIIYGDDDADPDEKHEFNVNVMSK